MGIGNIYKAEELLYGDGGISVADIREGENSITDLWYDIERAKAKRDGRAFDANKIKPPPHLDFRMSSQ